MSDIFRHANFRRVLFVIIAVLLLVIPAWMRLTMLQYNDRGYLPPDVPEYTIAATPVPTATPFAISHGSDFGEDEIRPGPVVVDLTHGNLISRSRFEPLGAALAQHGVGLRFWIGDVDVLQLTSYNDFPDQADELETLLTDASALVVVSPFFFWSKAEIALVERFVADGGRLLLISDPDIVGDLAQDINNLAEPFGIIFNDDYLYDTVENDGNHIYVFQEGFAGPAAELEGSTVAVYGARSISGAIEPLIRTTDTALSSLRSGITEFTILAAAGTGSRHANERVLAMSDFDVLTAPYVERHDNDEVLNLIAAFLAGGERQDTLTDFPAYLGKEIALVFGNTATVDAAILLQGAKLQQSLEETERTLTLAGTTLLSSTLQLNKAEVAKVNGHTINGDGNSDDHAAADSDTGDGVDSSEGSAEIDADIDLIVLADYMMVAGEGNLLADVGFHLVEEVITPEPVASEEEAEEADGADDAETDSATATPTPTTTPIATPTVAETATITATESASNGDTSGSRSDETTTQGPLTPTVTVTGTQEGEPTGTPVSETPTPTAGVGDSEADTEANDVEADDVEIGEDAGVGADETMTPTPTATPTATPTPEIIVYLETDDGLRLLARETVLIAQRQLEGGHRLVAVLGDDNAAIRAGVDRLLESDYSGCVTSTDLAVCSYEGKETTSSTGSSGSKPAASNGEAQAQATPKATSAATPTGEPDGDSTLSILVIDDDDIVESTESSEADTYLQVLTQLSYAPKLWSVAADGVPTLDELMQYEWVIWSSGGYTSGGPGVNDLDALLNYINIGGHLTISSRRPFFGMSVEDPSAIVDVVVDGDMPALVQGLPTEPFQLPAGLPPVVPLESGPDSEGPFIVLRRGRESANAGAPLLFVASDADEPNPTGARLMVLGMALTWLPDGYDAQLVRNMVDVMLDE